MSLAFWDKIKKLPKFLETSALDPSEQADRIRRTERNIVLPVKFLVVAVLFYYLFQKKLLDDSTSTQEVVQSTVRQFFLVCVMLNIGGASVLLTMDWLPFRVVQFTVFGISLLDTLFMSGLILITGGFESMIFWIFLGLIARNAISIPSAPYQLTLNVIVSICYLAAGLLDVAINKFDPPPGPQEDVAPENFIMRLALLWLMTACCYAIQILLDRQRRAEEEAREFALRQEQLRSTSRLAAEIAHQLKNPLGIINNAAFNLQRNVKEGKATITQAIRIIREEVDRSDRIITNLMGYARLAEDPLEKIEVVEELDRAIDLVLPSVINYPIELTREYSPPLPPLMMQRSHLNEIFVNILLNAREAMPNGGKIKVAAQPGPDYSVLVNITDNGPGVPLEIREKIFEPYYTTKEKGSGLGLAIVRHNIEIYGGSVKIKSELGKGTEFLLTLPAKSLMKIRR
jgi:signal transduction histidine kinase